MRGLLADIRLAFRTLRKQPGFFIAAVVTLALGIGSNTAIFSVVHAVLLSPLPYPNSDRLVAVWERQPQFERSGVSAPDFRDWEAQARSFEALAAFIQERPVLATPQGPQRLFVARTSPAFFGVLATPPALGRTYDRSDSGCVAVLSAETWRQRFGGEQGIVGRTLTIDKDPCIVVGVLPAGFQYPAETEAWLLAPGGIPRYRGTPESMVTNRAIHYLKAVGRLRAGVDLSAARQEMKLVSERLEQAYPDSNEGHRVVLASLRADLVRGVDDLLLALLAAVAFVLLVAVANVAGLQLARASQGARDIVTRVALGATRWRLLRQLVVENLMLALAGAAAGLLVAAWGIDLLMGLAPERLPRINPIGINVPVLLFTLAVAVASGLAFGIVPALHSVRSAPAQVLHGHGRTTIPHTRLRRILIAGEIAVALALASGAGVLARSFLAVRSVPPGFDAQGVITMPLMAPTDRLGGGAATSDYFHEIVRRIESLPSVEAAGVLLMVPMSGGNRNGEIVIEGRPAARDEHRTIETQVVTPNTFRALRLPLVAGRLVQASDGATSPRVAVVNQSAARRYFGGEDPIGKRISFDADDPVWIEIVGVVGDVHQKGLAFPPAPEMYQPLAQAPTAYLSLVVRSHVLGDGSALARDVRRAIAAHDPEQAVDRVRPLAELVAQSEARREFALRMWGLFAAMAMLLVLVGVYGVMAHTVAQRTPEIGIRLALGASPRAVVGMVLGDGLRVAVVGVALGVAGAVAVSRVIAGLAYGVSPFDPATLAAAAGAVVVVALVACALPAWRSARIDPVAALRSE